MAWSSHRLSLGSVSLIVAAALCVSCDQSPADAVRTLCQAHRSVDLQNAGPLEFPFWIEENVTNP
jgi:hypothetical protein